MISIAFPRVKNSKTIKLFSRIAPPLFPLSLILRKAYTAYFYAKGSPTIIVPLNAQRSGTISLDQENSLLRLYQSTYRMGVEDRNELDWIYSLRRGGDFPYCPMCGNTGRDALDHYLAKSHYPEYAVLSFNLVPTCVSCNSRRGNSANMPGTAIPLLHPYFDGEDLDQPLTKVKINPDSLEGEQLSYMMPTFELVPAVSKDHPIYLRLENHLKKCVDSSQLRRWISGRWKYWIRKSLSFNSVRELSKAVQVELAAEIDCGGLNNWTAAFLRGLLSSEEVLQWLVSSSTANGQLPIRDQK